MQALGLKQDTHTLVFDRGNNSKKNLTIVKDLGFYYVFELRVKISEKYRRLKSYQTHGPASR
jgi:hypothetical protein